MEGITKFFKKCKWDSIIIAILTLALGIVCVALPAESGDVLTKVFGWSLLVMGVAIAVDYACIDRLFGHGLLIGAVLMIISGIFCLIYPESIKAILTVLFGLYLIADSMSSVVDSIYLAKIKAKGWFWLLLLSVLTCILGVVVTFSTFESVVLFAGGSLIVAGAERLVLTIVFSKNVRKAKKEFFEGADL